MAVGVRRVRRPAGSRSWPPWCVAAALPALGLHFTGAGANLLSSSSESHQVEAALAQTSPPIRRSDQHRLDAPTPRRGGLPRRRPLGGPAGERFSAPFAPGPGAWEVDLLPHGNPYSSSEQRLVAKLRDAARPYGGLVRGGTAFFIDQKASIASHTPMALLLLLPVAARCSVPMTGSVACR